MIKKTIPLQANNFLKRDLARFAAKIIEKATKIYLGTEPVPQDADHIRLLRKDERAEAHYVLYDERVIAVIWVDYAGWQIVYYTVDKKGDEILEKDQANLITQ